MQDAWTAFAKDGPKGLDATGWSEYANIGDSNAREFGDGVAVKDVSIAELEGKCNGAALAT